MTPVILHYTEPLVRKAVGAFWWRTVGWGFLVALSVSAVCLGYLLVAGERSWFVGVVGAALALGLTFIAALYFVHLRGSLARFRRMKVKEAKLEGGPDKLRLSSDVGASEVSWAAVSRVWRFEGFWLLFFSPAQFVTLPLADLGGEAQNFIIAKVLSCGGKVV